ncbi:MAG TPA: HEAT repeat domain-containing protein [Thermoanaerobaculia bacterium]|nr:HEAT repeat domain-containing protein [Thermoanaerobaculia bacterium]
MSLQLRARQGLLEVRIEDSESKGRPTRIVVKAPGPPDFYTVKIRPESGFDSAREIQIGDASFDSEFFIEGPVQLVSALLDAEMRRLLSSVNTLGEFELSSGELRVDLSDEQVPDALPFLLDLGKRFAAPLDVPRRLAENAKQDTYPEVRLHNLLLLLRELPENPVTAEALRAACSDRSPEVRLRAAKELGAEGRGILMELANGLENDTVSAQAVSALERELPFERTRTILDHALSRGRLQTARVCLESIGRSGDDDAVDVLANVMEQEDGELAPDAAQALGATGSPAAEPPLILALQREQADLRVAAANALGRVGSVAAVLPLKETADRFLLGEIRRAARQAIAEIQSRVQGASPGQLSLAGAEAGQLSLAQTEAGQLSLTEDPAGQLSLPPEERSPWPK